VPTASQQQSTVSQPAPEYEISPVYADEIFDFLEECNRKNSKPYFSVSKLIYERGSNTPKEQFVSRFESPPDPDFLRDEYGPGSYLVIAKLKLKNGKWEKKYQTMHLADIGKPAPALRGGVPAIPLAAGPDNSALIELMKEQNRSLSDLLKTVLSAALTPAAPAANPADPFKLQSTIGEIIRSGAENQMEVVNRMVEHKANTLLPGSQDEETEEPGFMVEFISGLLEKWGTKILGANKTTQRVYKEFAQNAPEFELMQKRPEEYAAAYQEMINRGANKKELDAIIKVLGAPEPDLSLVEA